MIVTFLWLFCYNPVNWCYIGVMEDLAYAFPLGVAVVFAFLTLTKEVRWLACDRVSGGWRRESLQSTREGPSNAGFAIHSFFHSFRPLPSAHSFPNPGPRANFFAFALNPKNEIQKANLLQSTGLEIFGKIPPDRFGYGFDVFKGFSAPASCRILTLSISLFELNRVRLGSIQTLPGRGDLSPTARQKPKIFSILAETALNCSKFDPTQNWNIRDGVNQGGSFASGLGACSFYLAVSILLAVRISLPSFSFTVPVTETFSPSVWQTLEWKSLLTPFCFSQ